MATAIGLGIGVSFAPPMLPDIWAGTAPPPGYRWDYVYDDVTGAIVTDDATGTPVVGLVGI
jgi:hypothetical protein